MEAVCTNLGLEAQVLAMKADHRGLVYGQEADFPSVIQPDAALGSSWARTALSESPNDTTTRSSPARVTAVR